MSGAACLRAGLFGVQRRVQEEATEPAAVRNVVQRCWGTSANTTVLTARCIHFHFFIFVLKSVCPQRNATKRLDVHGMMCREAHKKVEEPVAVNLEAEHDRWVAEPHNHEAPSA